MTHGATLGVTPPRRATREPRHREIKAAPEEVNGTHLPDEARAKKSEQAIDLHQRLPESLDHCGIVLGVDAVLLERNRVLNFAGHGPDVRLNANLPQAGHNLRVEVRQRHGPQGPVLGRTVAGLDAQLMVDEVEEDLEGADTMRNRRGRETARSDVERDVPPMIDERSEKEAHLADDLRPEVQCVAGVGPFREWQ